MICFRFFAALGACLTLAATLAFEPVQAQDREVPYWASTKFDKVNMRVGPSGEYPIEWVYQRRGLPLKVVRIREGWWLVQDPDGAQGWVARSQLVYKRSALIVGEGLVDIRESPASTSALRWRVEPGVVGELLRCRETWCEIDISGRSGWVQAVRLWGAGEP